jgi:predicted  nucleic acid-binding Zn-ribbon protein
MSDTHAGTRATRRTTRKTPDPVEPPAPRREPPPERRKTAAEIGALLRLAELDAGRADRPDERLRLASALTPEVLEAYHRALRGGRRPAVVRLVASVCSGCYVRLHSKLDHQIRQRRGVAACPHCLRLVYDPAWLAP